MSILNQVCVLVLLDHVEDKSPDYIAEKMQYLDCDADTAFAALDLRNKRRAVAYLRHWGRGVPALWLKNVQDEEHAYDDLFGTGKED